MVSIFLLLLLNIGSALSSCSHGTYLHPRAAGGEEEIKLPNFDYGTIRGPVNWHNIAPENKLCGTGRAQSPININQSIPLENPDLVEMEVPVQTAKFENLGTTVEVVIEGKSVINCKAFTLKQFHFHTPSEHRLNGQHFPLEVHMVHTAEDNPKEILVVALIFQVKSQVSTAPLDTVISEIDKISKPGMFTDIPQFDLSPITSVVKEMRFFKYQGSLTTPPCTEGVTFLVASNPLPLNVDKYNSLKAVVGFNSRFIQSDIPAAENIQVTAAKGLNSTA